MVLADQTTSSVFARTIAHTCMADRSVSAGDSMVKERKKKTGKEQVEESYQPGNIGSMAGTIPSVKKKKTRTEVSQ
jgi:hypothetical protein